MRVSLREQGHSPRLGLLSLPEEASLSLHLRRKEGDRHPILTTEKTVSFLHLERRLDVLWEKICGQEYQTPSSQSLFLFHLTTFLTSPSEFPASANPAGLAQVGKPWNAELQAHAYELFHLISPPLSCVAGTSRRTKFFGTFPGNYVKRL